MTNDATPTLIPSTIDRMPLIAAKGTDMTIAFGHVPAPGMDIMDIPSSVNTAWDDLGQRVPRFVVLHRMYGSLTGTDVYFRTDARTAALTDYGLDNSTGRIIRWNDPWGRRAAWASGPYQSPSGDGPAIVAKLGIAGINRDGVSIEIAGSGGDPVSSTAYGELVALVAYHADRARVPHTSFPINPATGLTFVMWHGEFNGQKRDTCPGPVVAAFTDRLITDVADRLKRAQESTTTAPVVAPPKPSVPSAPAPPSALVLPEGVTLDMVKGWFGTVTSNGEKAMTFQFNESGPLTKLWLERGRKTGVWPQLVSVTGPADNRFFTFDGGLKVLARDGKVSEVAA